MKRIITLIIAVIAVATSINAYDIAGYDSLPSANEVKQTKTYERINKIGNFLLRETTMASLKIKELRDSLEFDPSEENEVRVNSMIEYLERYIDTCEDLYAISYTRKLEIMMDVKRTGGINKKLIK